jgi:hypothetical protein
MALKGAQAAQLKIIFTSNDPPQFPKSNQMISGCLMHKQQIGVYTVKQKTKTVPLRHAAC